MTNRRKYRIAFKQHYIFSLYGTLQHKFLILWALFWNIAVMTCLLFIMHQAIDLVRREIELGIWVAEHKQVSGKMKLKDKSENSDLLRSNLLNTSHIVNKETAFYKIYTNKNLCLLTFTKNIDDIVHPLCKQKYMMVSLWLFWWAESCYIWVLVYKRYVKKVCIWGMLKKVSDIGLGKYNYSHEGLKP